MSTQNTPRPTTQTNGSFYKTLLALRNTYPPEDDLGIPKLNEGTSQSAERSRDGSFTGFSNEGE
jgi:hypothetical protein